MARRGENIYERKDGRFEGRYIKDYDINGKAIIGYIYGRSYKEAKENWLLQKHGLNMSEANHPLKCIFRNGLKNGCLRKNI